MIMSRYKIKKVHTPHGMVCYAVYKKVFYFIWKRKKLFLYEDNAIKHINSLSKKTIDGGI